MQVASSSNTTTTTANVDTPTATAENGQNPKSELVRLKVSNLHRLVDADELQKFIEENHGAPIAGAKIHYYGPKSTGNGYIEVKSMPEAIEIVRKMNSLPLREQPITITLPNLNHEVRKIKREKHRQTKKVELPYQQELNQVKAKYPSFQYESETVPITFSIKLKPSDPEFPFDLESLDITIQIPESYPQESSSLISIENDNVPTRVKNSIIASWNSRANSAYKNKSQLLGLLRWLDNNMEKLLIDKVATQDFELAKLGIQIIANPRQNLKFNSETPTNSTQNVTPIIPDPSPINSETNPESNDTPPANSEKTPNTFSTVTEHKGTQIRLEGLHLVNLGILECTLLKLVFLCQRCRTQQDVNLSPGKTLAVECQKCHNANIVTYRKDQLHESSSVMGYLDMTGEVVMEMSINVTGVIPFDVLTGCQYEGTCLECLSNVQWKQIPMTGLEYSQNCENCHKKVAVTIERARFIKIASERAPPPDLVIAKKKKVKDPAMSGIRVGTPLPNEGTCKHYKKSNRWFRFPCCGRAFPCDICHDENNKDAHETMRASRMLCGFCSREQPISDKPCVCGADLSGVKRTQYWEGGKGMRDTSKLSKNDPRKFAGMHKTHSMKDTRVGPKNH